MLANLSIKSRLVFVIGFLSVLLVGIGILGLTSLNSTNGALKTVYEDRTVALGKLARISMLVNQNQITISEVTAGQLSAFPEDVSVVDRKVEDIGNTIKEIDTLWKSYLGASLTPEEKKFADEFDANRRVYGRTGMAPALAALRAHDFQQASELLQGPLTQSYPAVQKSMEALNKIQLDVARHEFEAAQTRYALVRNISIVAIVFGVMLAGLIGFWMIRTISRSLNEALRLAESVAAGDLTQTVEVHSNDEIGQLLQALKNMNASLVGIVGQVRTGTETIAVASREIASGNADLSSRTE